MTEQDQYTARRIFTGREWLHNGTITVKGDRIHTVTAESCTVPTYDTIVPAMIDLQIYGAEERLFSAFPDVTTLQAMHRYCCKGGAFWFMPTVATNTTEVLHQCIDAVRAYWKAGGKGCLGLHVEGPWIHSKKIGAHVAELVQPPSISAVEALLQYGRNVIRMITLAPEVCTPEIIECIREEQVVIAAGHSNATFEEAMHFFDDGIHLVTHLFNAMPAMHHRAPGLAAAAMLHPAVSASIIADGHHVDYAMISMAHRLMGDRLFLITDAVTNTTTGPYQHQLQGDHFTANGKLSGSALTMLQAVKNVVKHANIPIADAWKMATVTPAKAIGRSTAIGSIETGRQAVFVALDEGSNLVAMPDHTS